MARIHALLLAIGWLFAVAQPANAVDEPPWTLVEQDGAFEIRDYAPMVVAETRAPGDRSAAANAGFRTLFGFISGDNDANRDIAMTAPVTVTPEGSAIPMTAPVTQSADGAGAWTIAFIMPGTLTLEQTPSPLDPSVTLRAEPGRRMAVLRFGGFVRQSKLDRREAELRDHLAARGDQIVGPVIYAFYNAPWTPPWRRRNEVMFELAP